MKKTHKQIIYSFLKANEGKEFNHRQIIDSKPNGLGISEYSGRFSDLRYDFNCTCGIDQKTCTASEHIINTRKNFYKYIGISTRPLPVPQHKEIKVSEGEVKYKLSLLREQYRKAQNDTDKRLIELRARALQNILEPHKEVRPIQTVESNLFRAAREVLL